MNKLNEDTKSSRVYDFDEEVKETVTHDSKVNFLCPNCGEITREDVLFLCNTCNQDELIFEDGIYMCPSCLVPGENFECLKCESKEVVMKGNNRN